MKKLSAILSLLLAVGLFHQGVVFAEAMKEKKPAKMNFMAKKKHGEASMPRSKKAAVAAPVVVPPRPAPPVVEAPAAEPSSSPEASPTA